MEKPTKKTILIVTLITLVFISISMKKSNEVPVAKIGVVSYATIMRGLPEANKAVTVLEELSEQYNDSLQKEINSYQELVKSFNSKVVKFSEIERQKQLTKADSLETAIKETKMLAQRKITIKKQELISPIENRVNEQIKQLAKTNGYTHIFNIDGGNGSILVYANDYSLLNEQILKKLNTN